MMRWLQQYVDLVRINLQMLRQEVWFFTMIQVALSLSLVLGLGSLVPDISDTSALYLTTGTATQASVTIGLVALPQFISQAKEDGRLDYFFTLPISREAYLLAQVTFVALMALPGIVFALVLGAWHYGVDLHFDPLVLAVVPLTILSLAGVGIALGVLSPHLQLTNAIAQLIIFYVLFFAPVLVPKEQLPGVFQQVAVLLPPTYAADALRATVTDLPGTQLTRSLLVMSGFAVASLAVSSAAVRRRG